MNPDQQLDESISNYLHAYRSRARKLTPHHLTPEIQKQLKEVQESMERSGDRAQFASLLACMLYFGTSLRAEELCELGVEGIVETADEELTIELPDPAPVPRQVWLDRELTALVRAYRDSLPPDQDRLLADSSGMPLSRSDIYQLVTQMRDEQDQALEHFFPIYHESDYAILPTPLRLNADNTYTGRGVTIAFIDSGFYPHPDLVQPRNRVRAYVNVAEPGADDFAVPHESSWHGMQTSVAAAGNGYLSRGLYKGSAPDADVVLLKVRGRHGIQTRYILEAFEWILRHQEEYNIRIVNISLSGERPGSFLRSALDQAAEGAVQAGIVIVAAAGNSGWDQGSEVIRPPASAPSVITVGGLNDNNRLDVNAYEMYWSSYGPTLDGILKPELVAPGIWIAAPLLPGSAVHLDAKWIYRLQQAEDSLLKTMMEDAREEGVDWPAEWDTLETAALRKAIETRVKQHKLVPPYYQHVDGTSFSAPIVCSVIAQMLEANPLLTPARVKAILTKTADKLYNVPLTRQGNGLIHPRKAVKEAYNDLHRTGYKRPNSPHVKKRQVTFYYRSTTAHSVGIAGDFNGWRSGANVMSCIAPNLWSGVVTFEETGSYAYKFVVNGTQWVVDPENQNREPDGYGGMNARVNVMI